MQSLKDAIVVLGLLLLLVSVKVAPLESVGDVIPAAEAASAETDGGTALAGFVSDPSVPVTRLGQPDAAEWSNSVIGQIQVDAEVHDCESSIIHVRSLELEQMGDRIILRIDTRDGQAQVERLDLVEPAPQPRNSTLEACKIG